MVLKFINEQMSAIGIPYEFYEWTSEVKHPYFVGEIEENEPITEDGMQEYSLTLTGFTRGEYLELEEAKEKIKKHFHPIHGLRVSTDEKETITAYCAGAFSIPSGEAELKKIQINIKIYVWKEV